MNLVKCVATRRWEKWLQCILTWRDSELMHWPHYVVYDKDVVPAYQECYENTREMILAYLHDDLEIYEKGWDTRVLQEFADPSVGLVGFGGALGHGQPWLYQRPYYLPDLARQSFLSNLREAQTHGARFQGECDVAVVDGFAVFVRREILKSWKHENGAPNGFPQCQSVGYFMWCENLCCEVRRQGYRIRLVGVDCHHIGGRTSTVYQVKEDYELEHLYFYEHNRDVMPYHV